MKLPLSHDSLVKLAIAAIAVGLLFPINLQVGLFAAVIWGTFAVWLIIHYE